MRRYISAAPWKMSGVSPTSSKVRAISSISAIHRCALPDIAGTASAMRFACVAWLSRSSATSVSYTPSLRAATSSSVAIAVVPFVSAA